MSKLHPTGVEDYQDLQQIRKLKQMSSITVFLNWSNNEDIQPTLEAMLKMIDFQHDKGMEVLKVDSTLPNLVNFCLHKFTYAKIYPFTAGDEDLFEKFKKTSLLVHLSFLHAKQLLMKLLSESLQTYIKSIVRIDDRQTYASSMCQPMPTGLFIRVTI